MKNTLKILFAVVLVLSMCIAGSALTLETAETAENASAAEEATLAAAIVPGINIVNGKASVETFNDHATGSTKLVTWGGFSQGWVDSGNANDGHYIKLTTGATYPWVSFTKTAEAGRKYYIHARANQISTTGGRWWLMQSGAPNSGIILDHPMYQWQKGSWVSFNDSFTAVTAGEIYFQFQQVANGNVIFLDDLALVPYYKVTYATDGTTDQVLFADESVKDMTKLAATYKPKNDNYPEDMLANGVSFKCIGWSTTDGATAPMTEVPLANADITLYPVWEAAGEAVFAPEMSFAQEIRGGSKSGIRFKASISPADKAKTEEIGFIATREVLLPVIEAAGGIPNTDALTFDFVKDGTAMYASGVAYDKDGGIDIINSENTDGKIIYSAVTTGIPMTAKHENFVVRSYAKYIVGDREITVYSGAMTNNLYAVAEAIKVENGESYEANRTFIDSVLAD